MATQGIWNHPDPQTTILPLLRTQLPYSVVVLRRIQHHFAYPSSTAHVIATFPPPSPTATEANVSPSSPWMVSIVDLFRGRETQVYIYSSLEKDASTPPQDSENFVSKFTAAPEMLAEAQGQLLALLRYMKTNLLPEYLASRESTIDPLASSNNTTAITSLAKVPAPPPTAFLVGAMHTGLLALLTASGGYSDLNPIPGIRIIRRDDPPYIKYLFPPETCKTSSGQSGETVSPLPKGYRFTDRKGRYGVLPHQFDLVSSRTHIPRSRESLAKMPGVAIYYDGDSINSTDGDEEMPIAWEFLAFDGSFATLHVEPEHRGRGLAVQISREIMRSRLLEGEIFRQQGSEGEAWGHVDVATYNLASRAVMKKIGGKKAWTVTWTVIELTD
ncbi:hypothetical protein Plec18167_007856 [Paecilomyces lecythidis]|uniref:GCN5-related N-acetyltransferase Rv2170-like domain-containing protein n=1 Tax=Paecilomyces lecythidis TaxID=3004212 RepID=A0ABR3X117_9EURO